MSTQPISSPRGEPTKADAGPHKITNRETDSSHALVIKGTNDPSTLEALAVREALALADDLNIRMIHVASDCKVVVDDIKNKTPAIYGAILHEIIDHSSTFISCTLVHEFRSSNFETHNLAKHCSKLRVGCHVWLGHPGDLSFVPMSIVLV